MQMASQLERTPPQKDYCDRLAALIDKFCDEKLGDLGTATIRLGRFQKSPFTEEDLQMLRQRWFDMLPDKEKAKELPENQALLFQCLGTILELMGDPNTEIIDDGGLSSFVEEASASTWAHSTSLPSEVEGAQL